MLRVPRPQPYMLVRAPLVQAVVQVRYPVIAHLQLLSGVAQMQDKLKALFPFMEQKQQQLVNFSFNSGGVGPSVQQTASVSWEFTSDEHAYMLTLESGAAALSIPGQEYQGVENLRSMVGQVVSALEMVEEVRRCDRIGVRFLNVHPAAGGYEEVLQYFRTELVGLIGVVPSTSSVPGAISQLQLSSNKVLADNSEVQGIIHAGLLPAESILPGLPPIILPERSFFMDCDIYSPQSRKFRTEGLLEVFTALHSELDAIFHFALTEDGKAAFGLESRV